MAFDPWTFALQTVNFLVLLWLLKWALYKPILARLDARRAEIASTLERARQAEVEAERARREAEAERAELIAERSTVVQAVHTELKSEEEQELAAARARADALLADARRRIEEERREAVDALQGIAAELAVSIATRLLSEATGRPVVEAMLERLEAHLHTLGSEARADLLAAEEGPEVATWPALDPEDADRWGGRLADALGRPPAGFVDDPDLVAGVEIRMPAATIAFSFRDALRAAMRELSGATPAR
ncbi:MAG TPA: hypothetical protein ENK57_22590 [Polyangiaceae bacterium]|nr:hypothetical protein [Polyangiaceae bacterium]